MEVASRNQTSSRTNPYLYNAERQAQTEASGSETEGRARRKFQRTADTSDNFSFRKPSLPASAMRTAEPRQAPPFNRRRSILRDNKPPMGPRPQESSPSKRIFSEGTARSFLPNSASEPVLQMNKIGNDDSFGFGDTSMTTTSHSSVKAGPYEFLPPVSFDDFQTSIASYEPQMSPQLSEFPIPGRGGLNNNSAGNNMARTQGLADTASGSSTSASRQPRNQQFARRFSHVPRQTSQAQQDTQQLPPPPSLPLSLRTRRQSQVPTATAPPASVTRTPRKSVGPGILANMGQNRRAPQDQATNSAMASSAISRTPSLSKTPRRTTMGANVNNMPDMSRLTAATRSSKAKSLQPLPRENSGLRQTGAVTPGQQSSTTGQMQAGKARATTPSSSGNKARSGRMSGLGGRTVSPTDARRLKRLSMAQNPMPVPTFKSPPTPQPEFSMESRLPTRSPSLIPRKTSMTPSSARNTPESSVRYQQPHASATLSTSSSFQSLRGGSALGLPKPSQPPSVSTSKLPTPKSRNVYSSAERRDEVVPPVPAIPKAYESPKDQIEIPFFSNTKLEDSTPSTPPVGSVESDGAISTSVVPSSTEKNRHRRVLTVGAPANTERAPALPAVNKKSLQPLRLPPLNLLPLSTPTAAKINSYPQPSAEVERREAATPPRRNVTKTPSTPMTASKATFFRRNDQAQGSQVTLRSASSHHALRAAMDRTPYDDSDNGVPLPMSVADKRQTITPFASGSLPKHSGEYARYKARQADEYTLGHGNDTEPTVAKPMGPRPRAVSKPIKDTSSTNTTSSTEEVETPSSTTSLRRKLSLGWRRSSSKAAKERVEETQEQQAQNRAQMPPPRLPASATWSGPIEGITQVQGTNSARPSLDTGSRKSSVASSMTTINGNDRAATTKPANTRSLHSEQTQPGPVSRSSSWSLLGARLAATKASSPMPRARTDSGPRLDKDDMAANDEMKRLSSKRREVDTAAKETDELRKRAVPQERMSPAQAIQTSAGLLNIYEKGEIIDFKDGVYFCGTKSAKKHVGDISAAGTTNFGYDDERGDYNIVMGDHLAYRYEVIDVLGKGSFGQVVRCIDHKHGGLCAVKIIRNKKRFHQQALVEVNILQKLKEWDPDAAHATLSITTSFYFRSHLCIVTPCLSINLYELIRAHSFTGFNITLIRRFARQMLACLCLLQSKKVIHCDLKPENILLCDARRADIRVIDFGSSCKADEKVYTYIQSRFYRSPEVILGSEYGLGIDMWSFGCILAELYTGYPIFPGENEQEQLACIMEIFGPPPRDIIEKSTRRKLFFDSTLKPRVTVSSKGRRRRPSSKTLSQSLKCEDEAFLDFIAQCLRWDPERRLRPDQAVSHPFITNESMRRPVEDRKARIRSSAAVPTVNGTGGGIPSPVKRVHTTTAAVPTNASQALGSTPAKERSRPLPDTPASSALRMGAPTAGAVASSPIKGPARRQSSAVTGSTFASQGAVAGSKRASNGALLAQQVALSSSLPRAGSGKVDLAGAAARESMGAVARWR